MNYDEFFADAIGRLWHERRYRYILPLLEENARLGADKSEAENMNDILSLLEENAQLRRLVVALSNIILKSVADQK
jgi:hypothetical protein